MSDPLFQPFYKLPKMLVPALSDATINDHLQNVFYDIYLYEI